MSDNYALYRPYGAAKELFYCRDTECLIVGSAGTGKSRSVCEKLFACMVKYPGARGLIVRKTRASLTESVLVTLEEKVIPRNPSIYPVTNDVQRRNRQSYDFPNCSTIVVGGLDNPERIMSTEFDCVTLFEGTEATLSDWESLLSRLRNGRMPYQQAILDCNPGPTSHWINHRANAGQMTRLISRHEDNPALWDGEKWTEAGQKYIAVLDRLTGVRRTRLREGRWASAEGVVYGEFDPITNMVDKSVIRPDWRRIRSIDFGYTHPFVAQWWAIDGDGRMYLYRELYGTQKLVEDWAKDIKSLSEGEKIECTVADHDAEGRATLRRYGVDTVPAFKSVESGIEAVRSRMRKAGDTKPRLFLCRDALVSRDEYRAAAFKPVSTEQEMEVYIYGPNGKKEEPLKENDDGCDALRYAVAYIDNIGRSPIEVRIMGGGTNTPKERFDAA